MDSALAMELNHSLRTPPSQPPDHHMFSFSMLSDARHSGWETRQQGEQPTLTGTLCSFSTPSHWPHGGSPRSALRETDGFKRVWGSFRVSCSTNPSTSIPVEYLCHSTTTRPVLVMVSLGLPFANARGQPISPAREAGSNRNGQGGDGIPTTTVMVIL